MPAPITEEKFLERCAPSAASAFRLETRDSYALGYERVDFGQFLAGSPVPPPQLDWWRPWLDRVTQWRLEGKTVGRVRVLADPPTDYQRWMLWADRWHAAAGRGHPLHAAAARRSRSGFPMPTGGCSTTTRAIIMAFDDDGNPVRKTLVTEPDLIARYRAWRDLAIAHATPARAHRRRIAPKETSAPDRRAPDEARRPRGTAVPHEEGRRADR